MYKIDRREGGGGGVQKSYTKTDPNFTLLAAAERNLLKIWSISFLPGASAMIANFWKNKAYIIINS